MRYECDCAAANPRLALSSSRAVGGRARRGRLHGFFRPSMRRTFAEGHAPCPRATCPEGTPMRNIVPLLALVGFLVTTPVALPEQPDAQTAAGWVKSKKSPVLGGPLGTCFDVAVLREGGRYRMWFSWRPKKSIALAESEDGLTWGEPVVVLGSNANSGWEDDVNRPVVIKKGDTYHMWYTGQARGKSWIGYATSADGKTWKRQSDKPVLSPERPWEKVAVMCPHVLYDDHAKMYRMWYSAGEQYEPNAIGYATSPDGLKWARHDKNPIFRPEPKNTWERDRVTACQVVKQGEWHVMFYIGFSDQHHAQIGLARSKDGISGWQRHPANPIIRPGPGQWTPMPSTSRSRSLTAGAGCSGTTGEKVIANRSAWPSTMAKT